MGTILMGAIQVNININCLVSLFYPSSSGRRWAQLFAIFLSIFGLLACGGSNDDSETPSNGEMFTVLGFDAEVRSSTDNSASMKVYVLNANTDASLWDVSVKTGQDVNIPMNLQAVAETPVSYVGNRTVVEFTISPQQGLDQGDYILSLSYLPSGQEEVTPFIVREAVHTSISATESNSFHNSLGILPSIDFMRLAYFQGLDYRFLDLPNATNVEAVVLQSFDLDDTWNPEFSLVSDSSVEFTMPATLPEGNYFLSVRYASGSNTSARYYYRTISVFENRTPVLTSINGEEFAAGDSMQLNGEGFRYEYAENISPVSDNLNIYPYVRLRFFNEEESVYADVFLEDSAEINEEGTQVQFTIPEDVADTLFASGPSHEAGIFEGFVAVSVGPLESNAVSISISL